MIEVLDVSKRYGNKLAVDHLTFTVMPGSVTGFLGPNGAGKSTTMRMIVGLDHPSGGKITIGGKAYAELSQPLRVVGALLDAGAAHPGRSARNHLLFLSQTHGISTRRVDEVIDLVGLRDVARQRVRSFSLGMSQRLGIAVALLGDPQVLILDEPINGLDPDGIYWVRHLLRRLASQGRTILVSSHLMSEMAQTADNLVVIGRGKLIAHSSTTEFIERNCQSSVLVRTPETDKLRELLVLAGGQVSVADDGLLTVVKVDASRIGDLASDAGISLHQLSPKPATLEEAFMHQTHDTIDYGDSPERSGVVAEDCKHLTVLAQP